MISLKILYELGRIYKYFRGSWNIYPSQKATFNYLCVDGVQKDQQKNSQYAP